MSKSAFVGAALFAFPCLASEAVLIQQVYDQATAYFAPLPTLQKLLRENDYSAEMVDLGRHLFFDTRMSEAEDISCASCHDLTLGGTDGRPTSMGRDDRFGARNAPTVLNAALNIDQFWDARAPNLVEQVKGHVLNPIDMAHTQASLFQTLQDIPGYVLRFNSAFPNDAEPLGLNNFATAVAAFETTLITPSRFDDFVAGDTSALTLDEIFGMQVFFDLGCAECHNGVNLGGNSQNYFGIVAEPSNTHRPKDDTGVSAVTGNIHDEYLFRVPSLRNIAITGPYFHSGSADTLAEAVQVMAKVQLGSEINANDLEFLLAFLNTLTGEIPDVMIPNRLSRSPQDPPIPQDPSTLTQELLLPRAPAGRDPFVGIILDDQSQ